MKAVRTHLRGEHDQVLPAAGLDSRFDVEAWCQPAQAGIRGGAHRGSTLVARLRRGAGRKGSISLEVNGQPAGTVDDDDDLEIQLVDDDGPTAQEARAAAEMSQQ